MKLGAVYVFVVSCALVVVVEATNFTSVLTWAEENGYWWSPKIKFTTEEGKGVSGTAIEEIYPGDVLFKADDQLFLTSSKGVFRECEGIIEGGELCEFLTKLETPSLVELGDYSPHCKLVVYMVVVQKVKKGPFHVYVENLPWGRENENIVALWPKQQREVFRVFRGPYHQWAVVDHEQVLTKLYELVNETKFSKSLGGISMEELIQGFHLVSSRVFGHRGHPPNWESTTLAMIPVLDYLNHHPWGNPFCRGGSCITVADQGSRVGEEVLVSYGENTNPDLAIVYGFVPDYGNNPAHFIHLDFPILLEDYSPCPLREEGTPPGEKEAREFLEENQIHLQTNCYLNTGNNILRLLAYIKKPEDVAISTLLEELDTGEDVVVSVENEIYSVELLLRVLAEREDEFNELLTKEYTHPPLMNKLLVLDQRLLQTCGVFWRDWLTSYLKELSRKSFPRII